MYLSSRIFGSSDALPGRPLAARRPPAYNRACTGNRHPQQGGPVPRKTRINIGDRSIEAEDMEFKTSREDWNEYQVEDGFTVRIKLVVSSILKTQERDPQGNPVYIVQSTNIVKVLPPETYSRKEVQ